jgi:hypothetical protein
MTPKEIETIKAATGNLESSLEAIEAILDDSNNRPLYNASLSMAQALKHLYEMDPSLLAPETAVRIKALLLKENPGKAGRDSFNTGF